MELYFRRVHDNVLVLSADGGLDSANAAQFVEELEKVVAAGARNVVVDCGKLTFVSSYGLSVLIRLHKKLAEKGGDVRLAAVESRFLELLALTHLNRVFRIYDNVDDALRAIEATS